ncbi:MAG TPA: NAD(P)/FAD-dependent oxidoreductase [Actinomycetota bacterium]|nr:NAD(P)/FAD-dependent oxidoreductase [Actinomycetota bacterium]
MEDVVVCGGGPAGLAAALWLGRYRRKTVVLDAGEQRNLTSGNVHGYLTQDGTPPSDLLTAARGDVAKYPTVRFQAGIAISAEVAADGFLIETVEQAIKTRRLILAQGVEDIWPEIPGFSDHYGTSIFHCSCCDGYEARDQDVLAIGWGEHTAGFALDLLDWGARVTLVTNGQQWEGDRSCEIALQRHGVEVIEESVSDLLDEGARLTGARLASGRVVPATKAFFSIGHRPRNALAVALGCDVDDLGYVTVGPHGETSVDNVYACGDLTPGEQLVQAASSEGAIAGISCAISLRGSGPAPGALRMRRPPVPGPDPEEELASE